MSFGYDKINSSEPSPKKLLIIFGFIILGIFIILGVFVFPIKNLIREEISTEAKIISKNNGICVVNTPDHPRGINNCNYNLGDTVIVKYKEGTAVILNHVLKKYII
jgi:hypothetical protein